jgi:hypothetical protein
MRSEALRVKPAYGSGGVGVTHFTQERSALLTARESD